MEAEKEQRQRSRVGRNLFVMFLVPGEGGFNRTGPEGGKSSRAGGCLGLPVMRPGILSEKPGVERTKPLPGG